MPAMSVSERWFCSAPPWEAFTSRVVLPWTLQGVQPRGELLEVGAGGGAMAEATLARFDEVCLTATDIDPAMTARCLARLRGHSRLREVRTADVTALPYGPESFDVVMTHLMLHHVGSWREALKEFRRVLRPGGVLLGYDLTETRIAHAVHRVDRSAYRLLRPRDLLEAMGDLGFADVRVTCAFASHLMRFSATRS